MATNETPKKNETSKEDKLAFAEIFASRAGNIDLYADVIAMGKDLCGCCYLSLKHWSEKDEDVAKIFQRGMFARASAYMDRANQAADIPEFWEQPNLDIQGNVRLLTRERISAVNRAKAQIEHWRWCASKIAPELYGDYQYQLKEQDRKIAVMQQQLTDLINNKGR